MDQPYSFWADWLSKFHTASQPIQALWILALTAMIISVTWLVTRSVVEVARTLKRESKGAVPWAGLSRSPPLIDPPPRPGKLIPDARRGKPEWLQD